MLAALLLAAAVAAAATPSPVAVLRAGYEALQQRALGPRILAPGVRERVMERTGYALGVLEDDGSATMPRRFAELRVQAALDAEVLGALLEGTTPPLDAAPGAHAGIAEGETFAYYIPRGYDPRRAAPLVVFFHGHTQPETDLIARRAITDVADETGVVILAPGGDDTDLPAIRRSARAALGALAPLVKTDPGRRYAAGYSNGVFDAFNAYATDGGYVALLGIAGIARREDAAAIGRRLAGSPVYLLAGGHDRVIPRDAVKSVVRGLRRQGIFARYYETPEATHALTSHAAAFSRAWHDMLAGITRLDNDGLGDVTERLHW